MPRAPPCEALRHRGYAGPADNFDSRVTKYEHRLQEAFNFDRRETAMLCEFFLRGPQTPGELRARCERMHKFDDLNEIQLTLQRLMKREPALVALLPKQPGTKEARYAQLLSGRRSRRMSLRGHRATRWSAVPACERRPGRDRQRVAALELEVAMLREELSELKKTVRGIQKTVSVAAFHLRVQSAACRGTRSPSPLKVESAQMAGDVHHFADEK